MFPSFISILDIQSWWEVPSIAHFCSLFRAAFNLLDFDIEDLEEALLTDGTEDSGSSLLQELIVRLLCGCLDNNDISTFNYQMFLRRLFRQKCQEQGRYNPFNSDVDFQFLPLRTKVEILHALCDFRLDAEDVLDLLKNLEAESLRVEPLGYDDNHSAYWYFYGTRLYREDYEKGGTKKNKNKQKSIWQVVCFTEEDWNHLTAKFKNSTSKSERALYLSLSENFLPEIPRLFQEKEKLQRKRLLELQPRRTSSRVQKLRELQESRQESAEPVRTVEDAQETESNRAVTASARELRALQRDVSRSSASEGGSSRTASPTMPAPAVPAVSQTTAVGRQTNNSLASATGQIVIQPVSNPRRKKLKTSQVFRQTEEDLQTGMYKILEHVKNHEDAWPFIDPVEEDYAPNYYSVIRKPMDLQRMEDKLDTGEYLNFSKFKGDFQLIVDNCRLYNGTANEYTEMVGNLQQAFERATEKYLDQISSSDEEIAVEFQDNSKDASVVNNHKSNKRTKKDKEGISNKKKTPHSPKQNNKEESSKLKQTKQKRNENSEKEVKVEVSQQKKQSSRELKELKLDRSKRSKSPVKSNSNKKHKKVENKVPSRSMNRNRSVTKSPVLRRSWSHSPSPPPPVIHKKQKWKEKKDKKVENVKNKNSSEKKDLFEEKQSKSKSTHYDFSDEEREDTDIVKKYTELVKNSNTNFVKDKNSRLKETIEKLKQKSNHSKKKKELFLDDIFNDSDQSKKREFLAEDFCESSHSSQKYIKKKKHRSDKTVYEKLKASPKEKHDKKTNNEFDFDTEGSSTKDSYLHDSKNIKKGRKKIKKTGIIKNSDAIVALDKATEETLKDINKWLDDTPKFCEFSSLSNSPSTLLNNEDFDLVGSKIENDLKKGMRTEKPLPKPKEHLKDPPKRRLLHKDFNKIQRRREVQRTIDRLQPGKSKGNLISNIQTNKMDESNIFPLGTLSKTKDTKNSLLVKTDETAPKLSLGSVLDSFGQQHNFIDDDQANKGLEIDKKESELLEDTKPEDVVSEKKVPNVEPESKGSLKEQLKQEKVTPNLSAWFKAFGAPKSTSQKKKNESDQELSLEKEYASSPAHCEVKPASFSPEENKRNASPIPSPAPESPAVVAQSSQQPIPRTRKASTGSSVSERSSFSQDPLDSPRLSVDERLGVYPAPYPSPLHRSPVAASPVMASPHPDESQRQAAYPPISGAIRVGFYQDTVKNSPEKSCSPREQPHSPYQQYSQHVYTSNTSSTYQYNNPPSYPSQSPSQSPLYNRSESTNPISYPVTSPSQSPPSFPCRSPSHSPIYTQSQPNTPHAVATSPSQSPIYTTQSQLSSSYNSAINRAYFDTSKPLTDQYNSKLQNTAQYLSSVSETVKKLNTYTIDQTKQDNTHEQHAETKNSEKPQQSNTVFPVKKRLYNENMNCETAINRLSQNIQSAASIPGVNLSMFENNLLSGHQINIGPEQQQLNKELSDKLYSLSTGISVARTMDVNSMVASNSSYMKPSMGKSINNSISMNRSAGNVQGHIVETNRGLNLHLGSNTNQPLNIPNPVKTIDLTGPDPAYSPTNSDIGSQSSHMQSERNLTNEMQVERNMALTSNAIIQQMQQYQRNQDTFARNNKTIETQSNQQMMLSPSVSLPDAQEMSSRGLSLNMNLHNQRMADLRIPNVRNEIDLHNLSTITNQNIIDQVTQQRNEQNSRLTDTRITSANQSLNANIISNANYKTTTSFTSSSPSVGIDTLGLRGNYSNLAHMVDRYPNDERLMSGLQTANSSFYADKALSSQHMFAKGISSSAHTPNTVASGLSIFSQPNVSNMSTVAYSSPSMQTSVKLNTVTPSEKKSRKRKSKMQSSSPATDVGGSTTSSQGFQSYAELKCSTNSAEPSAISLKTASVVPGSAFNFGPAPPGIGLSASLYNDNAGFLDDYRNSTTNFYMPGTHHRSTPEVVSDKTPRNAHQSTTSSAGSFPFLSRPQSRPPAYPSLAAPFINPHQAPFVDTSSPLYQQYLQRRQEELLRHSSVLHQGLLGPPTAYPPGYHAALGMRQPFDTRPSWL